jgi:hypothetical protein
MVVEVVIDVEWGKKGLPWPVMRVMIARMTAMMARTKEKRVTVV